MPFQPVAPCLFVLATRPGARHSERDAWDFENPYALTLPCRVRWTQKPGRRYPDRAWYPIELLTSHRSGFFPFQIVLVLLTALAVPTAAGWRPQQRGHS